ncbi:MAG: hypothetical protein GF331_26485 [Chitinivibrionales bacterium]|nr:hypothetical protein [Chitinivibrionales bacterium]
MRRPLSVAFSFVLAVVVSQTSAQPITLYPYAPSDAPYPKDSLVIPHNEPGCRQFVGSLHAVSLDGSPCMVEVDYMRTYTANGSIETLESRTEFGRCDTTVIWFYEGSRGNLWGRNFLATTDYTCADGAFRLRPSNNPDSLYHWGGQDAGYPYRVAVEGDMLIFETRVRVTGQAGVQAILDLYDKPDDPTWTPTEAVVSRWHGPSTSDWQTIRLEYDLTPPGSVQARRTVAFATATFAPAAFDLRGRQLGGRRGSGIRLERAGGTTRVCLPAFARERL